MVFVWRSFYGMRIKTGSGSGSDEAQAAPKAA